MFIINNRVNQHFDIEGLNPSCLIYQNTVMKIPKNQLVITLW